jgi:hypothetical protein
MRSQKPLDYEELWDSFRTAERIALLNMLLASDIQGDQPPYSSPWAKLEKVTKAALLRLDWEFCLGKKFQL